MGRDPRQGIHDTVTVKISREQDDGPQQRGITRGKIRTLEDSMQQLRSAIRDLTRDEMRYIDPLFCEVASELSTELQQLVVDQQGGAVNAQVPEPPTISIPKPLSRTQPPPAEIQSVATPKAEVQIPSRSGTNKELNARLDYVEQRMREGFGMVKEGIEGMKKGAGRPDRRAFFNDLSRRLGKQFDLERSVTIIDTPGEGFTQNVKIGLPNIGAPLFFSTEIESGHITETARAILEQGLIRVITGAQRVLRTAYEQGLFAPQDHTTVGEYPDVCLPTIDVIGQKSGTPHLLFKGRKSWKRDDFEFQVTGPSSEVRIAPHERFPDLSRLDVLTRKYRFIVDEESTPQHWDVAGGFVDGVSRVYLKDPNGNNVFTGRGDNDIPDVAAGYRTILVPGQEQLLRDRGVVPTDWGFRTESYTISLATAFLGVPKVEISLTPFDRRSTRSDAEASDFLYARWRTESEEVVRQISLSTGLMING